MISAVYSPAALIDDFGAEGGSSSSRMERGSSAFADQNNELYLLFPGIRREVSGFFFARKIKVEKSDREGPTVQCHGPRPWLW